MKEFLINKIKNWMNNLNLSQTQREQLIYNENEMQMLASKEDIASWLDERMVTDYHINDDLTVDVNGNVCLDSCIIPYLTYIPFQFNHVKGNFSCSNTPLLRLKGSPIIVDGNCYLNFTAISSLENAPLLVGAIFDLSHTLINTLDNYHTQVGESFVTSHWSSQKEINSFRQFYDANNKLLLDSTQVQSLLL